MLGTKTINNMEILLYGNPKKKLLKITLWERYILCVFELVSYKKHENGWKAFYIEKQKDITRNVYNESFIISQETQCIKRKNSWIWRSFLDKKKCWNWRITLVIEKQNNLTKRVYFECFHILKYKNPKLYAKLALCGKRKLHYQKLLRYLDT